MSPVRADRLPPLEAASQLVPQIRAAADEIDAQRELPKDLAEAIADAGLFRMLVPRSLGGSELDMPTYIRVIEEIAKADASTAWCVNQGCVFATNTAFLPQEVARQIWGESPRSVVANGPAPTAEAVAVEGGYRVSGRWTFSSGCCHATWLAGFATLVENGQYRYDPDGTPEARYMLFPKSEAHIIDAWHVRGLRGTGSHHFAVKDLFVPKEYTVHSYADPVREPGPLYVYPMVLLFASGFASVAIGTARTALDTLIELSGGKKPRGAKDLLRDQAMVQAQVGRAEATWRAARAYLHETVRDVWEEVAATQQISREQRAHLRLATTHAIRMAADSIDIVYNTSGTTGIYTDNPIQRCFQDIHVITQHIQGRLAHYESVGQCILGLEPDATWF
jgi:alkylation response protein AidB-like acyl-CoA dehydrogenase